MIQSSKFQLLNIWKKYFVRIKIKMFLKIKRARRKNSTKFRLMTAWAVIVDVKIFLFPDVNEVFCLSRLRLSLSRSLITGLV